MNLRFPVFKLGFFYLFALPLGVIGRLCFVIVDLPEHLPY